MCLLQPMSYGVNYQHCNNYVSPSTFFKALARLVYCSSVFRRTASSVPNRLYRHHTQNMVLPHEVCWPIKKQHLCKRWDNCGCLLFWILNSSCLHVWLWTFTGIFLVILMSYFPVDLIFYFLPPCKVFTPIMTVSKLPNVYYLSRNFDLIIVIISWYVAFILDVTFGERKCWFCPLV